MDEERFWELIAQSKANAKLHSLPPGGDILTIQFGTLFDLLTKMTPEEILGFAARFTDAHRRAYRWDLWGAAYWLDGGCSDDGFTDFRASLISLGKELFYQVIEDPDSLADIVILPDTPYLGGEGFQYIASRAYQAVTGEAEMPFEPEAPTVPRSNEPEGVRWDFDDEDQMALYLPKLYERFPDGL